jgi:hypothetical protein
MYPGLTIPTVVMSPILPRLPDKTIEWQRADHTGAGRRQHRGPPGIMTRTWHDIADW